MCGFCNGIFTFYLIVAIIFFSILYIPNEHNGYTALTKAVMWPIVAYQSVQDGK